MKLVLAMVLAASPALAQETADAGVPQTDAGTPEEQALQKELEQAMAADRAAAGQGVPAGATSATPAPLNRGSQSLNPDISAIIDADLGWWRRPPSFPAGDDPDLGGDPATRALGATVQEVELALSAIVDPYLKGEVYLTIPNLQGIEVEEAFATTTSLPWNLQARLGSFRSVFGRQNGQHLHVQDFTRRPLINAAFLGADGLRGPAGEISWLVPLPIFLTLYAEAYSLRAGAPLFPAEGDRPANVESFGNDGGKTPTFVGAAKIFLPLGEALSLYGGLSVARGESPGVFLFPDVGLGRGRATTLVGGDLYVKWKPPNVAQGYSSLAWQTEAILRRFDAGDGLDGEWDGGFYSQVVWQFDRRFFLGLRGEMVGLPSSSVLQRTVRFGTSLTFQASEFARVRAYVDYERANLGAGDAVPPGRLYPAVVPSDGPAAFLQLEISIGAHGAHPF